MKKIIVIMALVAILINLMACDDLSIGSEWFTDNEREHFIATVTAESLAQRDEILATSLVENKEDLIAEADLIANTLDAQVEITITPIYAVTHKGKTKKAIYDLDTILQLAGNNPAYRVDTSHYIAIALAQNEVLSNYDKTYEVRLVGCRISWKHRGVTFYLVDSDLDAIWDTAGRGEFHTNVIRHENERSVHGVEELTLKKVRKMY